MEYNEGNLAKAEGFTMTFSEILTEYIELLDVPCSRLARASGLSVSAVANYIKGEREPSYDSEQTDKLINGILTLAREREIEISERELRAAFQATARNGLQIEYDIYLANLNALLKKLDVKGGVLAKALSYDASHISKILSGQRRPGDIAKFTAALTAYLAQHYDTESDIKAVAELMKCDRADIEGVRERRETMTKWLGTNTQPEKYDPLSGFLDKMDTFHLDDYIQAIHFNDIKVPTVPFQLPGTKSYYGLQEMMESELDFMKATVLSKSRKDCILYSDMPMEEMARDPEFPKKWMFGRAMMLKKGLHLHIIHNVNRPFNEMMLGLESHIPMYMTGQISPYYLPTSQGAVFTHLLNVSGAAVLEGNAVAGHQASGKYTLYKSREDIRHFRLRAEQLLSRAKPLMDIYRSDRREAFSKQVQSLWTEGDRRVVSCSLPLFTISSALLEQILSRADLKQASKEQILRYREECFSRAEALMDEYKVALVLPELTKEQFEEAPLNLSLSELFIETEVPYRYEEYLAHLEQTRELTKRFPKLSVDLDSMMPFRNISYTVIDNKCVMVSKNKFPAIHFVIHHRKMVQAFQNFIPPIAAGSPCSQSAGSGVRNE